MPFFPGSTDFAQSIEFSPTDITYIEEFTRTLQKARLSGNTTQELDHTIANGVEGALYRTGSYSLQLTIVAESLGATAIQNRAEALLDMVKRNPLLAGVEQTTVVSLSKLTEVLRSLRLEGKTDEDIASILTEQIEAITHTDALRSEVLKVVLLAFYAGATIHLPYCQGGQLLLDEVHSHQTQ